MRKNAAIEAPPVDPPEGMPDPIAEVWREVVESNDFAGRVDRTALEAYCTLVSRMREAVARVAEEGMVVTDPRGRVIPHPALAIERQASEQVRAWGDRFAPLVKPARKRGYMADATAASIAAASHLKAAKYSGPVAVVKTMAWLIDEAQRESMDALMKAGNTLIPNYLKACAELQITPASVPGLQKPAADEGDGATSDNGKQGGGSVTNIRQTARERRQRGAG